ncbi:MAG: hypothetical protein EOP04_04480 [Proteobacteria bacterium]|nr:MAG: hypothetical protein EOP04_04480 [Pseudomonadota bacterium]
MRRLFLYLFALSLFGHLSCKHRYPDELTDVDKAKESLNQGDYQGAIGILEVHNKQNPEDNESKTLLASAYAGSVGINLVDSYSFFETLIHKDKDSVRKKVVVAEGEEVKAIGKKIQSFLLEIASQSAVFFDIPFVKLQDRTALEKALATVRSVQKGTEAERRIRLYSGFLHLLQFTNYFKDIFPGLNFKSTPSGIDLICALETQFFVDNLNLSLDHFEALSDDLAFLYFYKNLKVGQKATELRKLAGELREKLKSTRTDQIQVVISSLQADYCQ